MGHLIGVRLAQIRLDQDLSRYVVCQRTGIYSKRITHIEQGRIVSRLDETVKLARVYGVDRSVVLEPLLGEGPELPRLIREALNYVDAQIPSTCALYGH